MNKKKELYENWMKENLAGGGTMPEAYALQQLVAYAIEERSYVHYSEIEFDEFPMLKGTQYKIDPYDIVVVTWNDPIFGYLRVDDGEDVLVYSTPEGLKIQNL